MVYLNKDIFQTSPLIVRSKSVISTTNQRHKSTEYTLKPPWRQICYVEMFQLQTKYSRQGGRGVLLT